METRFFGSTGLRLPVFSLGTMGFGGGSASPVGDIELETAKRMVSMSIDAGVQLFDTANRYGSGPGASEELLGAALGSRVDDVLISTKVHARAGEGLNDVGQSRWHIHRSCEASLRRLRRDHIDIYHVHGFDGHTPLDEVLASLTRLVDSGKVRYISCSNYTAWQLTKALGISERRGLDRYAGVQAYYSLIARELEWDIIPASRDQGVGILVWSPLSGGLLSGKIGSAETPEGSRRGQVGDLGIGPVDGARASRIVEACRDMARARDVTPTQVALNWVRANRAVSSVILGARTTEQLADNLSASSWELSPEEYEQLCAASQLPLPYPHWFQRQFTAERYVEP